MFARPPCDASSTSAKKENVFNLEVNTNNGMADLARVLMRLHIIFMVLYVISGLLEIAGSMMTHSVVERDREQAEWAALSNRDPALEVPWAMVCMIGVLALYRILRSGIQSDNKGLITGTLFCDSCCAVCNCLLGFCGIVGVASTFALKSYYDKQEDPCKCEGSIDRELKDCVLPCSSCFVREDCMIDVEKFRKGFASSTAFMGFWTVLVCVEMCLCAFAAVRLSWAKNSMERTPFCKPPSSYVMGETVGQPVQGTVVSGPIPASKAGRQSATSPASARHSYQGDAMGRMHTC